MLGLLSPGGVHSHERQIAAMVDLAAAGGAPRICVHAFLDGRDTPPRSAGPSLAFMQDVCARHPGARIASIVGRYYAMDRDQRWERARRSLRSPRRRPRAAYGGNPRRPGLAAAYARGEDRRIRARDGDRRARRPRHATMADGDVVVFMNFRADRARQLTRALTDASFAEFPHGAACRSSPRSSASRATATSSRGLPVAFLPQSVANGFGAYVASLGLTQLRIAETEKYAHVTYFFSGGVETPFPGEDRMLVPSPKVATYDLKPEMSAGEVTDKLVAAIGSGKYDAIVCNYANGDMVGHTGDLEAAVKAIETLDTCLGRVVAAARAAGGEVLITADHGNAEKMYDEVTGQPHTAHTLCLVPLRLRRTSGSHGERRLAAGHRADAARADGIAAAVRDDGSVARHVGVTVVAATARPGLAVSVSNHSLLR